MVVCFVFMRVEKLTNFPVGGTVDFNVGSSKNTFDIVGSMADVGNANCGFFVGVDKSVA